MEGSADVIGLKWAVLHSEQFLKNDLRSHHPIYSWERESTFSQCYPFPGSPSICSFIKRDCRRDRHVSQMASKGIEKKDTEKERVALDAVQVALK